MNKVNLKTLKPHLIAVGIFLLISVTYCSPTLQGKVLQQSDIIHWKGMAENSLRFQETHGYLPLWTNSLFCGMPAYQIAMDPQNPFNLIYIHSILTLFLPKPISFFFLLCLGFYFLSQVIRTDYRIGILGALAYAFMSFNPILAVAGHDTEIISLGYMPLLLGSIILVFQRRYWVGGAFTALFTANLVAFNHLQVIYYFLFIAGFMIISYAINFIKNGEVKHLLKSVAILAAAGLLGAATNMVNLATTYDYSQATMRNGGLNIDTATNKQTTSDGLNIDYAFGWSYGISETFSLLVPNIYGGSSGGGSLNEKSNVAKLAIDKGIPADQASQFASQFSTYWGGQPFTSGPVYIGAIICFLFIFGMIYYKGNDKWWMLALSILAMMMSWGKNFLGLNEFLFNHFPLYNKFRVPTMALVIPQVLFPFLSIMTLQQLFFAETDKAAAWKKLRTAGYTMLGIFVILAALYTSFTYKGSGDDRIISSLTQATGDKDTANSFYNALISDRQSLFGADILRSIFFAGAAFLFLWLMLKNKIKYQYALLAIILLCSLDVITEGRRYFNSDVYQTKDDQDAQNFTPTAADAQILQDTGYYRVLNLSADVFNDALTSYFHNSVGGYHPAKLAIMEDLLNFQLRKQPMNIKVLDMLNAKYVIVPGQQNEPQVQQNPEALGPCWFVKYVDVVKDGVAAMQELDTFNPKDTAVVEEAYKKYIAAMPVPDSTASIQLIKNDNDIINYKSSSKTNQFAVFSEIFYDRGWKAYIDDKEAPIVKTNYALRGLAVPAGNHTIRFEFKPESFYKSKTIAMASSAVVWALLGFTIFWYARRKKKENLKISK